MFTTILKEKLNYFKQKEMFESISQFIFIYLSKTFQVKACFMDQQVNP